jgi:hypothetical protein
VTVKVVMSIFHIEMNSRLEEIRRIVDHAVSNLQSQNTGSGNNGFVDA